MRREFQGQYLTHSELEKFEMNCTICGIRINLLEFSGHLEKHILDLKNKEWP